MLACDPTVSIYFEPLELFVSILSAGFYPPLICFEKLILGTLLVWFFYMERKFGDLEAVLWPGTFGRDLDLPLTAEFAETSVLIRAPRLLVFFDLVVLVFDGARSSGLNTSLSLDSTKVNWFYWDSASLTLGGLKISFHFATSLCCC